MVKLKIIDKLKKKSHKDIALLQDMLIDIVYEVFPEAIFHGGTAIWRCYDGTRFSDDIDVYIKNDQKKLGIFKEKLKQRRTAIKEFKSTGNVVFSKLSLNSTEVRFEASFLKTKGKAIIKQYETIEGNYLNILTFSAEDLIIEKVKTYLSRLLVRDLYDIHHLLNYVEDKNKIKPYLKRLLSRYKKPKDENILETLVFVGAVPKTEQMLIKIKRWAK
ncbi:hypothetical protein GF336_01910 [Candidatus Woesearchaeota archaeon]|nr:hypothetical protein [Candidatus Woesearchaeota archaeon]